MRRKFCLHNKLVTRNFYIYFNDLSDWIINVQSDKNIEDLRTNNNSIRFKIRSVDIPIISGTAYSKYKRIIVKRTVGSIEDDLNINASYDISKNIISHNLKREITTYIYDDINFKIMPSEWYISEEGQFQKSFENNFTLDQSTTSLNENISIEQVGSANLISLNNSSFDPDTGSGRFNISSLITQPYIIYSAYICFGGDRIIEVRLFNSPSFYSGEAMICNEIIEKE